MNKIDPHYTSKFMLITLQNLPSLYLKIDPCYTLKLTLIIPQVQILYLLWCIFDMSAYKKELKQFYTEHKQSWPAVWKQILEDYRKIPSYLTKPDTTSSFK